MKNKTLTSNPKKLIGMLLTENVYHVQREKQNKSQIKNQNKTHRSMTNLICSDCCFLYFSPPQYPS